MNPTETLRRAEQLVDEGRFDRAAELLGSLMDHAREHRRVRLAARVGRELCAVLELDDRPADAVDMMVDLRAWMVDEGSRPVALSQIDVATATALRADQRSQEAIVLLSNAQRAMTDRVPDLVSATLRHDMAVLLADLGRFDDAVTGFVAARESFLGGRDRLGVAAADHNLGCVLHDLGNLDDAAEYFQEARNIFLALGRSEEAAACDQNLGVVFFDLGRLEEAGRRFAVARHRFETAGAVHSAAECDYNLGALLDTMGHEDEAARYRIRAALVGVQAPLEMGLSGQVPAVAGALASEPAEPAMDAPADSVEEEVERTEPITAHNHSDLPSPSVSQRPRPSTQPDAPTLDREDVTGQH